MSETPPGSAPNYGSAIRMAQVVHWLHHAPVGMSLHEIRERLNISERTLSRYIQTLKDHFIDEHGESMIEVVRGSGGGRLRFRRKTIKMGGSAYELLSLYLALDLMAFMDGTLFHLGTMDVVSRMQDLLLKTQGNQTNLVLKDFHKKFFHWSEAPKDYSSHNQILEKLVQALVWQKCIELHYHAPNRAPKTHRLGPLSLLMYKRALYLVGRKVNEEDELDASRELTFAVERIQKVNTLEKGFFYPGDYEPERRFQSSFGMVHEDQPEHVLLRFDPLVAANVASRRWHPSQDMTLLADGHLEVRLHLEIGLELLSWLLSYGPLVQVLEPDSLRHQICQRLERALAAYQS